MLVCTGRIPSRNVWVFLQNQLPMWGGSCTLKGLNSEEGKVLGSRTKPPGFSQAERKEALPWASSLWRQGQGTGWVLKHESRHGREPNCDTQKNLSTQTTDLDPVHRQGTWKQVKLNNDICNLFLLGWRRGSGGERVMSSRGRFPARQGPPWRARIGHAKPRPRFIGYVRLPKLLASLCLFSSSLK